MKELVQPARAFFVLGFCLAIAAFVWLANPSTSEAFVTLPSASAPVASSILATNDGSLVLKVQERRGLRNLFRSNRSNRRVRRFRFKPLFQRQAPKVQRRTTKRSTSRPARPAALEQSGPVQGEADKNPDARRILVVGDFFAQSLARGLSEAFAQDRTVAVDIVANGTSGFVRYDHFNWEVHLDKTMSDSNLGGRADMVVVMMGGNDRQNFREPRHRLDSDGWYQQYEKHVDEFAGRIAVAGVPIVWVGMPPVRGPKTSGHMARISRIFRNEAEEVGGRYVDIWDAFADENGAIATFGPDVNGQRARLRSDNGYGLSRAGREKLVFFVKRQVDRFFSGGGAIVGTPGGLLLTADGPVLSLSGYALEDSLALKGGEPLIGPPMEPPKSWEHVANSAYNALVRGIPSKSHPDRADHFNWPAQTAQTEKSNIELAEN